MYFEEKGPLVLSAVLHFVLVVVVAITAWAKPDEDEDFEFEMVEDNFSYGAPPVSEEASDTLPIIEEYQAEEIDIPEPSEIDVEPIEVVVELPEEFLEPLPVEEVPEPEPEPVEKAEPPEPEQISFWEHTGGKEVEPQNIPKKREQSRPSNVNAPRIDVSRLSDLESVRVDLPAGERSDLTTYLKSLGKAVSDLAESHAMLDLTVEISFTVNARGEFLGVEVSRSSGDTAFDRKILDAFARKRSFHPPPGGGSITRILPFAQQ
ncbi:MAG: TonB family protein [Verrucomicrobiota bacterium]